MHAKSIWNYANKGLLTILGTLLVFTLASIIYLTYALRQLDSLLTTGGNAVGSALVLQDLLINVQDVETGSRGYAISGDDRFLTPYKQALERIPRDLQLLKSNPQLALSDHSAEQIASLTQQKLAVMKQTVDARRTGGLEAAQIVVASRDGDEVMQSLRDEITGVTSTNLRTLGPQQQASHAHLQRSLWVAATMALFILATCGAVIWYFQRAILRERALESTKSEFLSLASHQLRTPATNVKQYIGLLLDGYIGDITDEQRHALQVAYKNNESEINIMNDLLDVAKLDLNRIQLHRTVTDVALLARQVVKDNKHAAKERRQTISQVGEHEVMAMVDGEYIKGVIENLVDNAIKYSKDGTRITVRVVHQDDSVVISVKDHGLGIKKRDIPKLFNKFSRLDNEFSTSTQGSGLGLYWVRQIITLHGGKVEVLSKHSRGSVFSVRLPIR